MAAPKTLAWTFLIIVPTLFHNGAATSTATSNTSQCKDGILLPKWTPTTNLSKGDVIARGVVYFIALAYMFVGISIIADRFMAAIEVITSKEKEVIIKKPNGETQTMSVRIWNETVSNLTLMALGSSAPEILLSVIEVIGQGFKAGDLGPGTIVGSAAFNMFVIIAICVWAIPSNDHRKIKHLRVFFVTMTWSVFAYIWLYLILTWSSHGVIEIWEGIVTFLFFPTTVLTAYIADRRLLIYKYLSKKYRMNKRGVIVGGEGEEGSAGSVEMGIKSNDTSGLKVFEEEANEEVKEFEEHRREYIQLLRELRRKNPEKGMEELELMAREEILNRGPKSRAFYRLQATKKLTGGGNIVKKKIEKVEMEKEETKESIKDDVCRIFFDPGHYTVMESVGQFAITIARSGDLSHSVCVDFETEDGTAEAGSDYEPLSGTIIFRPGEGYQQVFITVIDDDIFEEDEHFYVRLSNVRYLNHPDGIPVRAMNGSPGQFGGGAPRPPLELSTPSIATVMILDDDHSGVFGFEEMAQEVPESVGEFRLKVPRFSGARGRVILPFRTVEDTAKPGRDYKHVEGILFFENNESWKEVPIPIVDNESYERDAIFYVELGDPRTEEDYIKEQSGQDINENSPNVAELTEAEKIALLGKPRLGDNYRIQLRIKESKEFKNTVDKLFEKKDIAMTIGTSSWKEQFLGVITVSAGDDSGDEDGDEEKMPSCGDYVMHFFTIFWKVLFAFVPPTDCFGGWACFVSSIAVIGLLTAVVGDLASHFGCTVGLKDSVTAISLVALGTSVPDTFASKVAAVNDKYADSSIGNVTGSNAVNVFLGIGVAWSIAAIYHTCNGSRFEVDPGNLAFSVTMFCCCAFISCTVLLLRRNKKVGGELGGPMKYKLPTVVLFVGLWCFYVFMSSLEAYGVIKGF